jgi:hypothetical protein
LMNERERPQQFIRWAPLWLGWQEWLGQNNLDPLRACLLTALAQPVFARIIVGVESVTHLHEILSGTESGCADFAPPMELSSDDLDLIEPSRWKLR